MVRSSHYLIFGLLSLSNQHGSISSREEVVQFLKQQAHIMSPVKLITVPSAPAELLKMDSVSKEEQLQNILFGEYSSVLVGVCRSVLQTLTLFLTNIYINIFQFFKLDLMVSTIHNPFL